MRQLVAPTSPWSFRFAGSGLVQRKCACGGAPGPTGECAACRRQRPLQMGLLAGQNFEGSGFPDPKPVPPWEGIEHTTGEIAKPVAASTGGCPANIDFRAPGFRPRPGGAAMLSSARLGGGVPAVKLTAKAFYISSLARARSGRLAEIRDWEFGFTQTMHKSQRKLCWVNHHEEKDELANFGGSLLDAKDAKDAPWMDVVQVKTAGRFWRLLQGADEPYRTFPLEIGRGHGDCLQSIRWEANFTTRLIARNKSTGAVCPIKFADWSFIHTVEPKIQPDASGKCPTAVTGASVKGTLLVSQEGDGAGSAPFELAPKNGHTANTNPDWQTLIPSPGGC